MKACLASVILAWILLPACSARPSRIEAPYGFAEPPYVHPRIVEDLSTWLCDGGDQVVAINLTDSQDGNRYHGEVLARHVAGEAPFVHVREGETMFGYKHVGTTDSGVHVLRTTDCGGGSGVFVDLMFVRLERDFGVDADWEQRVVRSNKPRLLIRKLGAVSLGDRWNGKLRLRGDELFIGRDEGRFAGTTRGGTLSMEPADRVLTIRIDGE